MTEEPVEFKGFVVRTMKISTGQYGNDTVTGDLTLRHQLESHMVHHNEVTSDLRLDA